MKVKKMIKLLALLKDIGLEDENIGGGHDIIYLPIHTENTPFKSQLKELGAFWYDNTCWAVWSSC